MYQISSKWRKPIGRLNKRRKAALKSAALRKENKLKESEKKSKVTENIIAVSSENSDENCESYTIMDDDSWSGLLSKIACSECSSINCLRVLSGKSYGYCKTLEVICSECGHSYGRSFSSGREEGSKKFTVNKDMVQAFLSIGKGHAGLEIFSMLMGMPSMDKKTFGKSVEDFTGKNVAKEDVLKSARDQVRKNIFEVNSNPENDEEVLDVAVSYDGTWQKRGHTSLHGIGIAIDILTGLVVDYEVLTKYCTECVATARDLGESSVEFKIWQEGHSSQCQKNFDGSSNSMEMCAARIIWERSIEVNKMRYTTVLSDGDAKTYQHLTENNVYGPKVSITKEECINHVSKRLGTALRNKIKELRAKGITISGRKQGNLKEETIIKLQNFYRKAIKDNAPDIQKMKTAIFATLYHCMSTDKKPNHNKCPTGNFSWCFYNRATASGESPRSHDSMKTKISENVVANILPVYQRLATDELLRRCTSAKTQNRNEALHSCIWRKCPKEVFVSKKRLELAVAMAVSEFNFGCEKSLKLCQHIVNNIDSPAIARRKDARRSAQKKRRSSATYTKPSVQKKIRKLALNARKEKEEGATYGAGLF